MSMPRILVLAVGCFLALAAVLSGTWWFVKSEPARVYAVQEILFAGRFAKYDEFISQAANRNGISPSLVKAVIWRESRFQPGMRGAHGERGLMQISEPAAMDWALAERIETFVPEDLFDPKTNIEVGSWYLARALRHWAEKDDPVPFALAEYNAGRSRVKRWERDSVQDGLPTAEGLRQAMDFPATRQYLHSIIERYRAYLQRGEFGEKPEPPVLRPAAKS